MSLRVLRPGLQTTVQAGPRAGLRHLGVPASGAADPLSLALANRLVGNPLAAAGVETQFASRTTVSRLSRVPRRKCG
jgi:allophanate hydrolase subunit 2